MFNYTLDDIDNIQMHFIIGAPRSGTTLTSSILNSHPNILATHENHFIMNHYYSKRKKTKWSDEDLINVIENLWIRMPDFEPLWALNYGVLFKNLKRFKNQLTFQQLIKIVYLHHRFGYKTGKKITTIIDKNPGYSGQINRLRSIFPNAKFICLTRHYLDQSNSILKKKKLKGKPILLGEKWVLINERIIKAHSKLPNTIKFIKYEEITENPDQQIDLILNFLDIKKTNNLRPTSNFIIKLKSNWLMNRHKAANTRVIDTKSKDDLFILDPDLKKKLYILCNYTAIKLGYKETLNNKFNLLTIAKYYVQYFLWAIKLNYILMPLRYQSKFIIIVKGINK